MSPGTLDLVIYQGDTFQVNLRLKTGPTSAYVDLTGYTVKSQIRARPSDADPPLVEFAASVDNQTTNVGGVTLLLTSTQTAALPVLVAGAVWDMQTTSPAGVVWTWLRGAVTVIAEVTR